MFGVIISLNIFERRLFMLSAYQLMKYLRNTHHINVKSSQTQALRNELPINIYNQVVGTQHRPNMTALLNFISNEKNIATDQYQC